MTLLLEKFLLIAALLGLWSGPTPGTDWKPETQDKREWAVIWSAFAILEGVRQDMQAAETEIADGTLTQDALGWRLFGSGLLLASVPDALLMEMEGPAATWQPIARNQYMALRGLLTNRQSADDPLAQLQALPTDKIFSVLNLHMLAHGEFSPLEIEQLRDTLARAFEDQQP